MDDFVQWLGEQFDEDERIARAATPGPWWYNPGKQWLGPEAFEKYDLRQGEEFVGYGGPHPFTGAVAATGPASNPQSMRDAEFIAAHHPERALREVDFKRQQLDEHQDVNDGSCGTCVDGQWGYPTHGSSSPQRYPCRTLRLLALPYADRSGYCEEWRP